MRIAALFGGGGTTLENVALATRDARLPGVRVVRAVAGRRDAGGITRCGRLGIPCDVVDRFDHFDADAYSRAVLALLDPAEIDLVLLAGWMSRLVLPDVWLRRRVVNVHPSLLPAFGGPGMFGRHVHEAVLAAGCRVTGCTVHYVDNGLDTGPIIDQACVRVAPGDTPETLADRVQAEERRLLVEVLRQLSKAS